MCPTQHHDKLYLRTSIRNSRAQCQKWIITTGFTKAGRFLLQVADYFKKDPAEGAASTQTSKIQIIYKFGLLGNKQSSDNSATLLTGTSHKVPPCSDPPASDLRLRLYTHIQVNSLLFFNLCFLVFLHFLISVRWHGTKKGWKMDKLDWELLF